MPVTIGWARVLAGRPGLSKVQAAVRDFVLQGGSKLIDVPGCDVDSGTIFEKSHAVAADCVAPDLQKQTVNRTGIEFLRR